MTDASVGASRRRVSNRSIVEFLAAAAVGFGLGFLVDILEPNPTYGFQIIADAIAIFVAVAIVLIPPARRLRAVAIGGALGVIAGVAIGLNFVQLQQPSLMIPGTVDVILGKPEITQLSASAECYVVDGVLVELTAGDGESSLALSDGRNLRILIGHGNQEPVALDRALDIDVSIRGTLPDGSATETRMVSDATSTVSLSNAGPTGSMSFSGLVLHELSELRQPVEVAGTMTWSCG